MKKTLVSLMIAMLFSVTTFAKEKKEKVADKAFWAVSAVVIGTTILDVESTHYVLDNCSTCYEANPRARPYVEKGRLVNYGVQVGINAVSLYVAYRLKKSNNRVVKKIWWLIPVGISVGHAYGGQNNIRVAYSMSF